METFRRIFKGERSKHFAPVFSIFFFILQREDRTKFCGVLIIFLEVGNSLMKLESSKFDISDVISTNSHNISLFVLAWNGLRLPYQRFSLIRPNLRQVGSELVQNLGSDFTE